MPEWLYLTLTTILAVVAVVGLVWANPDNPSPDWKKIVAWLPMYACYWTGHFVANVILERIQDSESTPLQWLASRLFRFHYYCMRFSVELNNWAGFTLWKR